jgi:ABC-type Fe3+/spermidine/putrescine transport system ATPase subunit
MDAGRIVQAGTGRELYEQPRTRFVAQFLGGCNLLPATVTGRNGTRVTARTPVGAVEFASVDSRPAFTIAIRPENIAVGTNGNANHFFRYHG